jgi:DNA-binding MarR family transcriptional regulator
MSQRLIVLESKGFIRKTPDVVDKRRVHLEVTEEGKAVLAKSYPPRIWPPSGGDLELETLLDGLLRQVVAETGGRMFGQCRTCRFHEVRGANDRHCGLLQLPLTEDQAGKLCREHELRRSREMTHPC